MKIDKSWYPYIAILVIAMVGIGIQEWRKNELLSLKQRYSIGTIVKIEILRKQSRQVTFVYEIDHQTYSVKTSFNKSVKVGEKYIVTLPLGHEDNGYLLTDIPVPNEVKAPTDGWDELPTF